MISTRLQRSLAQRIGRIDIPQHTGILDIQPDATVRMGLQHRTRPFITLQPGKRRPEIAPEQHRMALSSSMTRQDYR